jgi:N-acetylglucosaminyldiphosphoundecaprenol N-acetyl-beta-D-mannosaminyltransferase
MKPKRIDILGVPVDCVNMEQALDVVDSMIRGDRPERVIAINPEKVIKASGDASLLARIQDAGLLIPDGIGVVLAARILGLARLQRVPGSELMPAICARAARNGVEVFLFGASPEVNMKTAEVLRNRYPGLHIAGLQHGYIKDEEMPNLIERINHSGAKILFIALGSPKQELWMDRYLPLLNVKVCQGVGGTFDVIAGHVARAPRVFRNLHLEWFYRLITNPRRLLRQTSLPRFAFQVFRKRIFG